MAVVIVAVGVPAARAFAVPPLTSPAITAPTDGATVGGDVTVTATSGEAFVQFLADGSAIGGQAGVVSGSASVSWPTVGLANGTHSLTAEDCNVDGCGPPSTAVSVTVANAAAITAPADGATVGGDVTVSASSGEAFVQFLADGSAIGGQVGVVSGSASVSWPTVGLANGSHTLSVEDCPGGVCGSPSPTIAVTVANAAAITAPADGATVGGDVTVSASSGEAFVQFLADGSAIGGQVGVVSGSASVSWPTWGIANGSHTLSVEDCPGGVCGSPSPTIAVTVANNAPVVTAPVEGASTDASVPLSATADGGAVAFVVDGTQVGVVTSAPYDFTVSGLAEGAHQVYAKGCDVSGSPCAGEQSAPVDFTVVVLHPAIVSVSPNPFSPRRDGRDDSTAFRVDLPQAASTSYVVKTGDGSHTVQGPHTPGLLAAGTYTFHWNGRDNSAAIVPDGTYQIVVTTTADAGGVTVHGRATHTVKVDDTAPTATGLSGSGSRFYPVVDGYLDTFSPHVTVSEGGRLYLRIFNSNNRLVRSLGMAHASPGTFGRTWDGRNTAGVLQPAGHYRYHFLVEDFAGNRRLSADGDVGLSRKRLVMQSVVKRLYGDQRDEVLTNDVTCTQYSLMSSFAHGLLMGNACLGPETAVIQSDYHFGVPAAAVYASIHLRSYGNAVNAPEPVLGAAYDYRRARWVPMSFAAIGSRTSQWSDYGTLPAADLVRDGRLRVAVVVPNIKLPEDYDVGIVKISISYGVLQ